MKHDGFDFLKVVDGKPFVPEREGPRPTVTNCAPHSQLDQFPSPLLNSELLERFSAFADIEFGPSMRAPYGTVGLHMHSNKCCNSERAFLLGQEIAHVHPPDEDGSMHAILPEPWKTAAIEASWAEQHPMAGMPTVSPDTVLIYAPRNEKELDIVSELIKVCWMNAHSEVELEV